MQAETQLGQPIIALGAAIVLGWLGQIGRLLLISAIGAATVVAIAFALGLILPEASPNTEVLIRTAPDLRDLFIAVFAGAAGAFGYYRSEFSTVLSGVAISVALVPPLCVRGLMLHDARYILATGAGLLFLTNFMGIVIAAALVFFLTGVAHSESRRGWFVGGTIVTGLIVVALLGPLAANYHRLASPAGERRTAYEVCLRILRESIHNPKILALSIDGAMLTITLDRMPADASESARLATRIERALRLQVLFVASGS